MRKLNFDLIIPIFNEGYTIIKLLKIIKKDLKKKKFNIIGDVRGGQGLMAAIEVVSDQKKKTAMSMNEMKKLHQSTYEAGAMVRLGLNNILMSPPLVISEAEIDQILDALDYGFSSM